MEDRVSIREKKPTRTVQVYLDWPAEDEYAVAVVLMDSEGALNVRKTAVSSELLEQKPEAAGGFLFDHVDPSPTRLRQDGMSTGQATSWLIVIAATILAVSIIAGLVASYFQS
jgi:hypothetical protein